MISLPLPPSFPAPLYMCLTLLLPPFPQLHSLSIRLPTSLSLYLTLLPTTPLPLPLQPFSHHTSPHISFSFFQPLLPLYLSLYLFFLSLSEMWWSDEHREARRSELWWSTHAVVVMQRIITRWERIDGNITMITGQLQGLSTSSDPIMACLKRP